MQFQKFLKEASKDCSTIDAIIKDKYPDVSVSLECNEGYYVVLEKKSKSIELIFGGNVAIIIKNDRVVKTIQLDGTGYGKSKNTMHIVADMAIDAIADYL